MALNANGLINKPALAESGLIQDTFRGKSFPFITVQGREKTSRLEPPGPTQLPTLPLLRDYTQPCDCCSPSAYSSADVCLREAGAAALSLGGLPVLSGCFATKMHRQTADGQMASLYPLPSHLHNSQNFEE